MDALPGLMSVVRECPDDGDAVVDYWKHSQTENVVMYQCSECSTQVVDLDKSGLNVDEYVFEMITIAGIDLSIDEFVERFEDKPLLVDGELTTLVDEWE